MEEMFEFYNKHWISVREDGAITDGWSDGPHPEKDTAGAVLENSKGQYQFRLVLEDGLSEENPCLYSWEGVPLFSWNGSYAEKRPQEDIDEEISKIPPPPPTPLEVAQAKIADLDTTTQETKAKTDDLETQVTAAQMALCDVYEAMISMTSL